MAEGDSDLLDARQAMAMLGIDEAQLQALVQRGDIKAFRSAGTMKFRREELSTVKDAKGTEPTIVVPSQRGGAKPGSKPSAHAAHDTGTADIVLPTDDFDLVPMDDSGATQQVTASQPAVAAERTVVEPAAATESEPAHATAPAPAVRPGSGRSTSTPSQAIPTPAMSRVKAAVQSGSSHSAATKKVMATAEGQSANPIFTAVTILTAVVFLYTASICGVLMLRGSYDPVSHQRIIPPYLSQDSQLPVYKWMYENTPGHTKDAKPSTEFGAEK